jgi:hypothetical protein
MRFYRYAGMADGSNRWAVEQKIIGTGWGFREVAAGGTVSGAAPPQPLPSPIQPPPASDPRCSAYARSAISDYDQMRRSPKCSNQLKQDTARWNRQFDAHYNWCRQAQDSARKSEIRARDKFLLACGARSTL